MRKISADHIYPITSEPIKNGVITIDEDGVIVDISPPIPEESEIEYYEGIICPGFVNTHCHLELSHMRGQVHEQLGMTGFIKEIITKRSNFSEAEIEQKIAEAEAEMIKNGIVAVGDISNNNSTFKQKSKGNLLYYTFIEAFDLNPDKADEVFKNAFELKQQLQQFATSTPLSIANLQSAIIPHAPYSVSEKLFELISEEAIKNNSILSIHNQESLGESELFISHSGSMFETFSKMGIDMNRIPKTGLNSLRTTLPKLPASQKTLLVHNTYTSKADIEFAENRYASASRSVRSSLTERSRSEQRGLFWCTCPNANMYIENKLPDYDHFINANANMTIGTDSLASNWSLSVLDELKTISKYYPQIPMQTLLLWATKNGADFLGFTQLGTIEKGKKPGLNLLKKVEEGKITSATEVIKLI